MLAAIEGKREPSPQRVKTKGQVRAQPVLDVLPVAGLAVGLAITVAWVGLLGCGLPKLF